MTWNEYKLTYKTERGTERNASGEIFRYVRACSVRDATWRGERKFLLPKDAVLLRVERERGLADARAELARRTMTGADAKAGDRVENLTTHEIGVVHGASQWGRIVVYVAQIGGHVAELRAANWERTNVRILDPRD